MFPIMPQRRCRPPQGSGLNREKTRLSGVPNTALQRQDGSGSGWAGKAPAVDDKRTQIVLLEVGMLSICRG